MTLQVFISYHHEYLEFARKINAQLHGWGYETWLDKEKIKPSTYFRDAIQDGLEASDILRLGVAIGNLGIGHSNNLLPQIQPSYPPKVANIAKYHIDIDNLFAKKFGLRRTTGDQIRIANNSL